MSDVDTDFKSTLLQLGLGEGWEFSNGSWWLTPEGKDVRAVAGVMLARGARLVTVTAADDTQGEFTLDYHWDYQDKLLTFVFKTQDKTIASIVDLTPAADWVEREMHDYFVIGFSGRESLKPLMLRPGDQPGIHLSAGVTQ